VVHHLVHLGISPAEKAIRTVAVYLALLVLLHLTGKRALAQLNSFDLVVLLLLSNVVQNAIIGNDNSLLGGLLGALILLVANWILVRFAFMSPKFGKAIQGGATVVASDGHADEDQTAQALDHGRGARRRAPASGTRARRHGARDARARGNVQRDAEAEAVTRRRHAKARRDRAAPQRVR
jgi:hypothetical protein